ncbi:MAG: ACT domain-containing protein [Candidatus Eremiobacteraeota bacterium]|nr:ACT domain-containing protein [Candidatus Eremiobacteraeota bacterium]
MQIRTLDETFALARLPASAPVPEWVGGRDLIAVVRTRDELSIVCRDDAIPATVQEVERGFRGLCVVGTLDFGETSVIAGLTAPLAAAGIAIFNISTFDTDYILLREDKLEAAKLALSGAGYDVGA